MGRDTDEEDLWIKKVDRTSSLIKMGILISLVLWLRGPGKQKELLTQEERSIQRSACGGIHLGEPRRHKPGPSNDTKVSSLA
jgi:hypothetical protein